ncbi:MAG: precorrin-6Y C5,15-methyltransferase (decarboxylating) subunit CbiT [Nitrososphaerota archaeon]|jgi:cobalt-precorrin-6B (C15)-methyltransferase|nr:precorrin-6Y C5,15-methyltransferase (decarboxylating) subunit CbiT [Nitrososphaerota archaeon]
MVKNWTYKTPGIPDEAFNQSETIPGPTKEEIRVITIAKARLSEGDVVVDVGCGTGGLTVEAALQIGGKGRVYAIDEDIGAVDLTKSNAAKFGVENSVIVTKGKAPEALLALPIADVVFVGGGGVSLRAIIQTVHYKLRAGGRIVINAILLETATVAMAELKALGYRDIDVVNVLVAKGKQINSGTMMLARNPVTIVSATKL